MKTVFQIIPHDALRDIKGGGSQGLQACMTVNDCLNAGVACPDGKAISCERNKCVCV